MPISGNATTAEGLPADFVRIFSWPTGELVGVALPDESGDWSHEVPLTGDYGLTYIAAGCQPITHGPYYIESNLWTPSRIVTALWLDASDSDSVFLDEYGNVESWIDRSGNARSFTQAVAASRPALEASGPDSRPKIFFDTSKYLERSNGWNSGNSHSIIAVVEPPSTGNRKYLISAGVTESAAEGNAPLLLLALRNNNQKIGYFDGSAWRGSASATNGLQAIGFVLDGTNGSAETYRDGANLESGLPYAGNDFDPTRRVILGARVGASTDWSGAKIGEIIKIDGVVEAGVRQRIEGYLAHKWDLAASLPVGHPYKESAPT